MPKLSRVKKNMCPVEKCGCEMRTDNLTRHLRDVHKYSPRRIKEHREIVAEQDNIGNWKFECKICKHSCITRRALQAHVSSTHVSSSCTLQNPADIDLDTHEDHVNVDDENEIVKVAPLAHSNPRVFPPRKTYVYKKAHTRTVNCPSCKNVFGRIDDLVHHFGEHVPDDQRDLYTVQSQNFASHGEYKNWLAKQLAWKCGSLYIRQKKQRTFGTVIYMRCTRSGQFKSKASGDQRIGHNSMKNVTHCTCFVKCTINHDGSIKVQYCFGHSGHLLEAAYLRLSYEEQSYILGLMKDGLDDKLIRQKLRERCRNEEQMGRAAFITKDNLRYLRERYKFFPGRLHDDDIQSATMRIEKDDIKDGFRLHVPCKNNSGDDFALVMINNAQLEWLKEHSHRGIICDDTHHVTRYGFKLTTIMVVDHLDRGLPAAYLLSSSVTSNEIAKLFGVIQQLIPDFSPRIMMTRPNLSGTVFPEGQERTKKVLCRWHILKNWKERVKKDIVGDPMKNRSVIAKLRSILLCPHEPDFRRMTAELISFLNKEKCEDFLQYFQKYYINREKEWATYCRDRWVVHTSMMAESWHNQIKQNMGTKKGSMRLDGLIQCLVDTVQDILDNYKINDARCLSSNYRTVQTHSNHREAVKLSGRRSYIISGGNGQWELEDLERPETLTEVKKVADCICNKEVNVHCQSCGVCPYSLLCSCNIQKAGIACPHMHIIAMSTSVDSIVKDEESDNCTDVIMDKPLDELNDATLWKQNEELAIAYSMQDARKESWMNCKQRYDSIDDTLRGLARNNDPKALELIKSCEKQLQLIDQSLKKVSFQNESKTFTHGKRKNVLTVRAENNVSRKPKSLPQNLTKRNEKLALKRRARRCDEVLPSFNTPLVKNSEMDVCTVCLQLDPVIFSDADEDEYDAQFTDWMQCSQCETWVHELCAFKNKTCDLCKKGQYLYAQGNRSDSDSVDSSDDD